MQKIVGNIIKFDEQRFPVSGMRVLAQNYIDRGVHPSDYKPGNIKNELALEYSRRKNIQIKLILKNKNRIKQLKNFLNIRSKGNKDLFIHLEKCNYQKLDKIYNYLTSVSHNEMRRVKRVKKSKKIRMRMGPNRKTRKKYKK